MSDDFEKSLKLQGVPWIARKAVKSTTVTVTYTIQAHKDENETAHMVIQQSGFGPKAPVENRVLDWNEIPRQTLNGPVTSRSRFIGGIKNTSGQWHSVVDMQTNCGEAQRKEAELFLGGEIAADGAKANGFLVGSDEDGAKMLGVQHVNESPNGWTGEEVCTTL